MDDEDLAEMAALRKTSRFQTHQRQYGNRSAIKTQRDRTEARREEDAARTRQIREDQQAARDAELSMSDDDDDDDDKSKQNQDSSDSDSEPDAKSRRKRQKKSSKEAQTAQTTQTAQTALAAPKAEVETPEAAALRAMMPMSFGSAGRNKARHQAVNTAEIHAKLKRKDEGQTDGNTEEPNEDEDASSDSDAGLTEEQLKEKETQRKEEKEQKKRDKKEAKRQKQREKIMAKESQAIALAKNDPYRLPISHEVELKRHKKTVLSISVEPSGARVLTGGADYICKFWDFGGMNQEMRSFRKHEPEEAHPVRAVSHNPTGSLYLCCTGSSRPKIYDRDGFEQAQFSRGDMYLHDMKYTKGHVTSVTQGQWHPSSKDKVLTCSVDGTVRIWNINQTSQCLETIKVKVNSHRRVTVSACCYSADGSLIAGADNNGALQVWQASAKKFIMPHRYQKKAHTVGLDTTSICFSRDNNYLLSRNHDHTMKIWDMRKFTKPVKVWEDLQNLFPNTKCMFSPDGKTILTGVAGADIKAKGSLRFWDATTYEPIKSVETEAAPVALNWHPSLNQIFMGCSDGVTRILYSPTYSNKGVLLCAGKRPPRKDATSDLLYFDIKTPNSLPMYKEVDKRKERIGLKKNPLLTKRPEMPPEASFGGRVAGPSLTMHIIQNIEHKRVSERGNDPRDQILKYAEKAAADPIFFGKAYGHTQPEILFDTTDEQQDVEDDIVNRISNNRQARSQILTPQIGVPEERKKDVQLQILQNTKDDGLDRTFEKKAE